MSLEYRSRQKLRWRLEQSSSFLPTKGSSKLLSLLMVKFMGRGEASQQPAENAETGVRISVYAESPIIRLSNQNKGIIKPDRVAKRPRAVGRSELLAYARELRESHNKASKKWRWVAPPASLLHPEKTWKYKADTVRGGKFTSNLCGKLKKILKELLLCGCWQRQQDRR